MVFTLVRTKEDLRKGNAHSIISKIYWKYQGLLERENRVKTGNF